MSPFKHLVEVLSLGICWLLSFQLSLTNTVAQTLPTRIDVVVVEGEGAINNVRQRVARDPMVRVEDENHRPVAGAAVVFTLPVSGPSGEFSNGSKSLTVITEDDGTATAHGLKLNQVSGRLQIYVTVSYRGLRARTLINQTLQGGPAAQSHGGSGKWIAIVAVVAAAAAGGAVAATRGKGSTASATPTTPAGPTPIGITPGTPTLSPPH